MSYLHYASHRLGIINPDNTVSRAKSDITLNDFDKLCFLVLERITGRRQRIVAYYSVRQVADFLEQETLNPSDPKVRQADKGRKKRLSYAKTLAVRTFDGLSFDDMNMIVQIAKERYETSIFYKDHRKHKSAQGEKLPVIVDECISKRLAHYFASDETTAFHVSHLESRGKPDKDVLNMARGGIIATEDRDFLNLIEAIYIERVTHSGKSSVVMSDLPFVLYIERKPEKPSKPNHHRDDNAVMTKADRRAEKRQKKKARGAFNAHRGDLEQIQKFKVHLKEIMRLTRDVDRPYLAIAIRYNGNIEYYSRNIFMDRHFNFAHRNVDDSDIIRIDGRAKVLTVRPGKLDGIFAKACMSKQERAEVTLLTSQDTGRNRKPRYGEDKPYALRHKRRA